VELPGAYAAKKVPIKDVSHVYVNRDGVISIDDKVVDMTNVGKFMSNKKLINPNMIASLMIDKDTNYGFVNDIFEEFSKNGVLRISLSTKLNK
jgi:biopolymer transport protein ExbD